MAYVNVGPNNTPIVFARDSSSGLATYVTATGNKLDTTASVAAPTQPSAFVNGQTTTTGSAVQFAANTLTVGVIVQALSTNAASIYIGGATVSSSNGMELQPGQATSVAVSNTNTLYITGTNGDKACWIGS